MKPITGRLTLKWIVILGSLLAILLAVSAVVFLVIGHQRIVRGTESIKQVTVPGVLETTRLVRNLEHLRRYGDSALSATSAVERYRAEMSITLIAMHPGMQANETVKERIRKARMVLSQALAMAPLQPNDQVNRARALALWSPVAEDISNLADELTVESSKRALAEAQNIHIISTQTIRWLSSSIVTLLLYGLLSGVFLLIFIARPLQRTARVLDCLENNETHNITLSASPVIEIDRLRIATDTLALAMANAEQHRTELEHALWENSQRTKELENALSEIKVLRGIIPICASCKNIRDDQGLWKQWEMYVREHSDAEFSHGLCPACIKKLYPEQYEKTFAGKTC